MDREAPSKQIVGIDLLRLFAAVLVVVYHLCFYDWTARASSPGLPLREFAGWSAWTSFGWVGVEVFFVISGFVIAYSAQGARPGVFAVQRLARLVPGALLCGTVSAVALWSQGGTGLREVVWLWWRSVTFRPMPGVDGSYWTLPIELAFYALVFGLLVTGEIRRLPAVVGGIGVVSTSLWVLVGAHRYVPAVVARWYVEPLYRVAMETRTLVWYGCSFAVGVFLWLCLKQRCTSQRVVVLSVCGVGTLLELVLRGNSLARECGTVYRPMVPAGVWLASVGFVVFATRYNGRLQEMLGLRGVATSRRLGMVTYPLYLLHHTVGFTLIQRLRWSLGAKYALLVALAVVTAVAWLIAMYPEAAVQRWVRVRMRNWTEAGTWERERRAAALMLLPGGSRERDVAVLTLPPVAGRVVPGEISFRLERRLRWRWKEASEGRLAG